MKGPLLSILTLLLFLSNNTFSQQDTWLPVVQDGFGMLSQKTIPEMEVFHDTLYVASAPLGPPATAKLWRSSTGTAPWEDVTPPLDGDVSIHSFGQTDSNGGYFWCGTGHNTKGAIIYQSRNGQDWTPISKRGFGTSALNGSAPNMVVFQGYLYAGAGSHGGGVPGEVWRIPYTSTDSNDWVKLIDFDTVATAINDTVDLISYFEVWQNKIYFGTNAKGQLWESSDGVTFTQNSGVGYGFAPSSPGNVVISAIEIFNDTMYLTTTNFSGGQLWRTGDGTTFTNITNDAFGEGTAVSELRKPIVAHGDLWLTGYTETNLSTGTPIWRSNDGLNWAQSNINGFGDTLNNGQNAVVMGFEDYMYFGGPNYVAGGQVWRTQIVTDINEYSLSNCDFNFYPNPITESELLSIQSNCSEIEHVNIFDVTGKLVKTVQYSNSSVVELSGLKKGIYFIQPISLTENVQVKKLIVD